MNGLRWMMLAAGLAAMPFSVRAESGPKPGPSEASVERCAQVTASARYEAYGHTHQVVLQNGCNKSVICDVWTDVDPSPRHSLRAGPGERAEVVTRRGSPAREVRAESSCRYE
jgi:hypothetical protein